MRGRVEYAVWVRKEFEERRLVLYFVLSSQNYVFECEGGSKQ